MATASGGGSPKKNKLLKQASQSSISTTDSFDHVQLDPTINSTDIDAIMNKRWKFEEVCELVQCQLATLPGGRDKNGGAILVMEGRDGQEYMCSKVGMILSYLSKIPDNTVQSLGFTIVLDMRKASWSQAKKALDALKLTFVEHVSQVIVMRPKSFWQRGKSSMSFGLNKSKYGFRCVMLEHSGDLFQHLLLSQVPVAQNGQLEYNHQQWIDIQKATESYLLQLISKNDNYLVLQEMLHHRPDITSLNDARDAVRHHVNLREQLDRTQLSDLSETITHSISRLRPLTSNPDFEQVFAQLEESITQLYALFRQLEILWEKKGETLDRILQYKIFENDITKHTAWLQERYMSICKTMTDLGQDVEEAQENKLELESFRTKVNSQHQDINRTIEMGERLMAINHPESHMIKQRCNDLGEKWEELNEIVEERMAMMFLAVNFFSKQDKFLQCSEKWIDDCGSRSKPVEVIQCEQELESHKQLKDSFSNIYNLAKQDGHTLIEKLRRPVGNQGVPRSFTLMTRFIKECLETLYDEMTLVDDQWRARQDHLKKTCNFRIYQRDTKKIFKWVAEVGNHFLLSHTSIGTDADSATRLLKLHDDFESSSEVPVVYAQTNLLQTRSQELISGNDCRPEEIQEEAKKLEEAINTFATHLDDRREIMVVAIECFKACNNFLGELNSIKRPVAREKFEGSLTELEERLARFKTHRDIIRKISSSTFKLWNSLLERLSAPHELSTGSYNEERYYPQPSSLDYAQTIEFVKERIVIMEETQQKVDGACQQRENHWSLSIERHSLVAKMAKHLEQLQSWLAEQSLGNAELADNLSDAELQRDIFKRQYDQQTEDCNLLIERGWEVNDHLGKLDTVMFGQDMTTGQTMKEQVELSIIKVEKGKNEMMKTAEPHLKQLNSCVLYYTLERDSRRLTDDLKMVSIKATGLADVGQTMEECTTIRNTMAELEEQFKALSTEVESFNTTVQECVAAGHYQRSSLSVFTRTLNEKVTSITKIIKDKKGIVKGASDFHKNYDKLKSTVEHCLTQFSSRDMGSTHSQIEAQISSMKEMRTHLEEAVEVVKSHATQLVTILGKSQPELSNKKSVSSLEDVRTSDSGPKLLVSPRKVNRQEKSSSPGPAATSGQQILEGLVKEMDVKVTRATRAWETRHIRLVQSKQVLLFEEEVPKVLDWLDKEGAEFINTHREVGKSTEEVEKLIEEYETFNKEKAEPITQQVTKLQKMMQDFEETGHYELNRIRSIGNHLQQRWDKFDNDRSTYDSNLKLSQELQTKLYSGSNWCMQSEQFLQSLDDKVNRSETSEEVGSLSAELSVFLLVTQGEQLERVTRIKEISSCLHSNLLVETSQMLASNTQRIIRDFEAVKQDLQTLHSKLVHIEEEKDKEMRMLKQRERVVEELLNTEESYVQDLRLVVETCKPRFISDFLPDSLRGKETIVFGNIQWIAEFHIETLLPALQGADGDIERIAQVFIDNVDILTDLYVPYCKNKTGSEELLASHRSYLSRVQSLFGTDYPLSSLLIKPIQRITKYPLLLKDALKYQKKLNLPTEKLEVAILAVEEPPIQTNNAINLSLLESEEGLNWHKYGELLHQGSLMVSEPRLLITSEKERQVFVFENTVAFARKIELGQAKFKYEYKFRIPITAGVQVLEFIEGEPCKFAIFTSDHRMHFRATTLDSKQRWVKSLRIAIHKHVQEEDITRVRSLTESNRARSNTMLVGDKAAVDLQNKERRRSPTPIGGASKGRPSSPFSKSRVNIVPSIETSSASPPVGFDTYKVLVDYEPFPDDHHGISLKKDQKVEVMEELEGGRCFVRATTITGQVEHGWVPISILDGPLPPEILFSDEDNNSDHDTIDHTHSGAKGTITDSYRRNTSAATIGKKDSQQLISTLRKVTLGDELHLPSPKGSPKTSPKLPKRDCNAGGRMSPLVERRGGLGAGGNPPRSPVGVKRSISPQPPHSPGQNSISPEIPECNQNGSFPSPKSRLSRKGVVRKPSKINSSSFSYDVAGNKIDEGGTPPPAAPPTTDAISEETTKKEAAKVEQEEKVDEETLKKKKEEAEQKLKYIMAELIETEREYVTKLEKLVNGYLKELQTCSDLPESLVGKEKMIFGNVEAIYDFHRDTFEKLLEGKKDSPEGIASCFLDTRAEFSVYVTYCENKPKSESFIWTFTHQGGNYFTDVQKKLGLREDIASFLIKPVQRITKYQLLLKDLFKTAQKLSMNVPMLEESLQLMKDVPKQANDAMALSMIIDYQGNIHANGQIIVQDEFTVYEKSRWAGGAKRHVFLLDRVVIITKEKDNDGLYVFKDLLKVHNMFHSEISDSVGRFGVGTGSISSPDKYYILEASSPEKKQEWTKIIKDLLNQQFEMLKALKQPNRPRNFTQDSIAVESSLSTFPGRQSIANSDCIDDISDSDLEEESEGEGGDHSTPTVTRKRSSAVVLPDDDTRKSIPFTLNKSPSISPNVIGTGQRSPKLYIAGDDCPPPVEGQKILYVRKGQVYDISKQSGDWWYGKLVRDIIGGSTSRGTEGWVPSTFMDPFQGQLSYEEEAFVKWGEGKLNKMDSANKFQTLPVRLKETNSINRISLFRDKKKKNKKNKLQGPQVVTQLINETILKGQNVQLKCELSEDYSGMQVQWEHNGEPLRREKAFISSGKTCVLKIQEACPLDEGIYSCIMTLPNGASTNSSAKLIVLGPPCPPGKPAVQQITSTSVSLTWATPAFDGHSPITVYLVECKDTQGNRWSTIMKRITEPATIVSDLVPGTEYVFRVLASNSVGSSDPSVESNPFYLGHQTSGLQSVFSLEPFDNHFTLVNELARGQFSVVFECLHEATQQSYVAKLIPLNVGRDHAYNELSILSKLNHPNIVQMTSAYLTEKNYIIVLQYVHGSPIFEYFVSTQSKAPSVIVVQCVFGLISGLAYLHEKGIAHLAIKPTNVIIREKVNGALSVKLIHFSHARDVSNGGVVATPSAIHLEYNAPELLLKESVSTATDMWSVGVLLYTLFAGTPPFVVESVDLTKENIRQANVNMLPRHLKGLSNESKTLIQNLLQKEQRDRPTAELCLQEAWLQTGMISAQNGGRVLDMSKLKNHMERTSV